MMAPGIKKCNNIVRVVSEGEITRAYYLSISQPTAHSTWRIKTKRDREMVRGDKRIALFDRKGGLALVGESSRVFAMFTTAVTARKVAPNWTSLHTLSPQCATLNLHQHLYPFTSSTPA